MAKRPKLTERFLKERYEKDDEFFTVYDHYTPNFKRAIVTGKFYSRFDCLDLSLADMDLVNVIITARDKRPRQKYPWPVIESHRYGWFEPLVAIDREDRRMFHGAKMAPFIDHEIKLKRDKTMQKPKFTGIPFKL